MQKRQAVAMYIVLLVVIFFIGLGLGIFLDYCICELLPNFGTCIEKINGSKTYGYIYQEEIALTIIISLLIIVTIFYWKNFKKKIN